MLSVNFALQTPMNWVRATWFTLTSVARVNWHDLSNFSSLAFTPMMCHTALHLWLCSIEANVRWWVAHATAVFCRVVFVLNFLVSRAQPPTGLCHNVWAWAACVCVWESVCVPVYVYVCVFDLCACSLNVWCRARVYRYECACWTKQSDTRRIFSKIYSGWFLRLKNNQIESHDSLGNLQHLAPWAWTGNSTQNHQQQKSKVGKLPTQKLYTGYWGFDGNVLGANRSYFAETLGRFGRAKISQTQKDNSSSKRAKPHKPTAQKLYTGCWDFDGNVFEIQWSNVAAILSWFGRAKVQGHQLSSNISGAKTRSWGTQRAITFERMIGLGRAAACGVQNSIAELIVPPFARKMKSLGLVTKLKVTHTSSTFWPKMQILTFPPNALNNWERFDMLCCGECQ